MSHQPKNVQVWLTEAQAEALDTLAARALTFPRAMLIEDGAIASAREAVAELRVARTTAAHRRRHHEGVSHGKRTEGPAGRAG